MKHKPPKLNKIFATLLTACLVAELLTVLTPPASANYWDNWTELGTSPRTNLTGTNNFKVTVSTTITPATTAGSSSLVTTSPLYRS